MKIFSISILVCLLLPYDLFSMDDDYQDFSSLEVMKAPGFFYSEQKPGDIFFVKTQQKPDLNFENCLNVRGNETILRKCENNVNSYFYEPVDPDLLKDFDRDPVDGYYLERTFRIKDEQSGKLCLTSDGKSLSWDKCLNINENNGNITQIFQTWRKKYDKKYHYNSTIARVGEDCLYVKSSKEDTKVTLTECKKSQSFKSSNKNHSQHRSFFYIRDAYDVLELSDEPVKRIEKESFANEFKDLNKLESEKRNNVFLFFVDTLRSDRINSKIAPAITKFRDKDAYSFSRYMSGATSTYHSMFSLMNSRPGLELEVFDRLNYRRNGSLVSRIFNHLDYDIALYSDPRYFESIDESYIKGKSNFYNPKSSVYPDTFRSFLFKEEDIKRPEYFLDNFYKKSLSPMKIDKYTVDKFSEDLPLHKKNHSLFSVVYLFAAHNPYVDDSNDKDTYHSVQEFEDFLKLEEDERFTEKAKIQARKKAISTYDKGVSSIDKQFEIAIKAIKDNGMYDDSYIIFMGDHGEGLGENGKFFHGETAYEKLIDTPIYLKVPGQTKPELIDKIGSHIDIFPTIFGSLGVRNIPETMIGRDVIKDSNSCSCQMTSEANGDKDPHQFVLYNKNNDTKLFLRFYLEKREVDDVDDEKVCQKEMQALESKEISIISVTDFQDRPKLLTKEILMSFKDCFIRFFGSEPTYAGINIPASSEKYYPIMK